MALAHGHGPEAIDAMALSDLELLATYSAVELTMPFAGQRE